MNLQYRIDLMVRLGEYMLSNSPEWLEIKIRAGVANGWFTPEFVDLSVATIANTFLKQDVLQDFTTKYAIPAEKDHPKTVGLVMAGNIPLVGFHDFLCVFLSGHNMVIKLSSKDNILLKHLAAKLYEWEVTVQNQVSFAEMLKGCDAYIATGSNNSARHFDYYFQKYPHIIRRNRTSVAVLTGKESDKELDLLGDDVHLYFGLGCRNVTHLFVPSDYNFEALVTAFKKYLPFFDHNKYKNNYDYQLALHLLNNKYYMSSGSLLLSEGESLFSPVSQVNYSFYENVDEVKAAVNNHPDVQCIAGHSFIPFGKTQLPAIDDFADGIDTMSFLSKL